MSAFARDPYIADLGACSLLAIPILGRGALRTVLLLENGLMRAAFATERLDAVRLIAAQLAVSPDNAQLHFDLTASRAYRTAADQARRRIERYLHDGAQQHLVTLAMRADHPSGRTNRVRRSEGTAGGSRGRSRHCTGRAA
jgi:GAF domain-containing protein